MKEGQQNYCVNGEPHLLDLLTGMEGECLRTCCGGEGGE